ncbi:MAG: radical SAM protein [Candidatus Sericytochromatia bacterium]
MPANSSWIIQLVQINQRAFENKFLPYAAGLLQAYVLRHATDLSRYTFLPFLFERLPLSESLGRAQLADLLAFSTYFWNIEYSLELARLHKLAKPDSLVIFGGPQVPDRAEDFLRAHSWVDVCVHGEGEITFLRLLESLPGKDWDTIPGISWIDAQGQFHHNLPGPRQRELDSIPSPYLQGVFEPLLRQPGSRWAALWETKRGCPFSCTFCDWGSATAAKVTRFGLERLKAEIDYFALHKIEMVYCCDANYGILPRDLEITSYMVEKHQNLGFPRGFYIQNTKNATERSYQIQKMITQSGMNPDVTLSLQSVSPEVLSSIKRDNISLATFRELQQRFQRDGVNTYTDILVGLPGETYDSFANGMAEVIDDGQHNIIKFYNVYVLPNAELNQPDYRARYGIETVRQPYFEPWIPQPHAEVQEYQEMVVAISGLDRADWRRIRILSWWVELLYLHRKLLQLPILLIRRLGGLSYRQIFEFYAEGPIENAPIVTDLRRFYATKALGLQQGESEFCPLAQGAETIWLTVEDFVVTGLHRSGAIVPFYRQNADLLEQLLALHGVELPPGLLEEATRLSLALFESYVYNRPFSLTMSWNIWDIYQAVLRGDPLTLRQAPATYVRDWVGAPFHRIRVVEEVNSKGSKF